MIRITDPDNVDLITEGKSSEKSPIDRNCHDDYLFTPMTQSLSQTFDYNYEEFEKNNLNTPSPIITERHRPGSEKCIMQFRGADVNGGQYGTHKISRTSNLDDRDFINSSHRTGKERIDYEMVKNTFQPIETKRVTPHDTMNRYQKFDTNNESPDVLHHRPAKRRIISHGEKDEYAAIFTSSGGKRIDISEESMARADAILGRDSSRRHHSLYQEDKNGSVSTFTSAGGNRIDISEESIARADGILGRDSPRRHHSLNQEDRNASVSMFTSAGGKRIDISEESMARADAILGRDSPRRHHSLYQEDKNGSIAMFTSAGGKRIDISEESMARADAILGRDSSKRHHSLYQEDKNGSAAMFTSAGGKRIDISEESMARADAILGGDSPKRHHSLYQEDKNGSAAMFTSAGGKRIDVSEESMARADAILDGDSSWSHHALHQEDRNGLVSTFTSAGGNRINISEESMARADAILGGDSPKRHHALHHIDKDGSVSMFTSAGGENIDVSVESIATEVAVRNKGSPKWCNNESRRSEHYNNGTEVLLMRKGDVSSSVTPTQTPYHPVPLITHSFDMHVGRRSAYVNRHRQSLSYAPITPVPINFSLYTNTESLLSRSSFEGKADQHINNTSFWFSPTGQKISLRDFADKYCPLARTADICVNTNLNKLLMDITSDNSHSVRFDMHGLPVCFHGHGAYWNMKLKGSVSDFRRDLLNCGCDGSLISDIWISNHCRWIIWKLAAMERKFQSVLAGKYLTYLHVVNQLQKRFHVELVRASRPAIRKVLNRDVSASTCMILCVNKILDYKGQKGIRIVLTDGWYEVPAFIDEHLQKFIRKGKIVVGSKLLVCNAILEGADEGIDPLDTFYKGYVRSFAIRLKLFANCTRLCAWSSKLGFVKPSKTIVCRGGTFGIHRLNHIIPGGGPIPSIDLIICKRYPLLFLEETRNKSNPETVRRIISEAENAFIEDKFEDECSRLAEEFAENVQKGDNEIEFPALEDRFSQPSPARHKGVLCQGQIQTHDWQPNDNIKMDGQAHQNKLMSCHKQQYSSRKSTPFVRFKVKAWSDKLSPTNETEAVLTIWGPAERLSLYKEGCVIRCNNLRVKSSASTLELSATNKTKIELLSPQPSSQSLSAFGYQPRYYDKLMYTEILSKSKTSNQLSLPEVDCAGCLVQVKETTTGLSLYLMDESQCLIRIEREIIEDDCSHVKKWKKGVLGLPHGSCLCYRDIRIIKYDPWEECSVAAWTESSSQQIDVKRVSELSSWYTSFGHNVCHLARLKLDCGIVSNPPQRTAQIIGTICSFNIQPTPKQSPLSSVSPLTLQKFDWLVSIDCIACTVQAIISPVYQEKFANICNRHLINAMKQDMVKDDLEFIVEYFSQQFLHDTTIFSFIIDTESKHIIDAFKICPKKLVEFYSLTNKSY